MKRERKIYMELPPLKEAERELKRLELFLLLWILLLVQNPHDLGDKHYIGSNLIRSISIVYHVNHLHLIILARSVPSVCLSEPTDLSLAAIRSHVG